MTNGSRTVLLVACFLFAGSLEAQIVDVPLETCWTSSSDFVPQPFNNELPALVLQWDSFSTSKIATSVAAMILKEKMGFNVRLEAGRTSGEAYQALSEGKVHLVMEAWTESNKGKFQKFVNQDKTVESFPYSTLFGRSGIYETCNRMGNDPKYPTCTALQGTEPLLRDVLATPEGQTYFAEDRLMGKVLQVAPEKIWTPEHCKAEGVNCGALILHIASEGYDEGQIEAKVELLKLPARVAYLGQANHSQAIWDAYVKQEGALVYGFFPNSNHYGISILDLPRAKIVPGLDFKQQNLMKLAWAGLGAKRGGDVVAFVRDFDLNSDDYAELSRLHDLFGTEQRAACTWLQQRPERWEHLVRFPEREVQSVFCFKTGGGMCTGVYIFGWVLAFLQFFLALALGVWSRTFDKVKGVPIPENARAILEAVLEGRSKPTAPMEGRSSSKSRMHSLALKLSSRRGRGCERDKFLASFKDLPLSLRHKRSFANFARAITDPDLELPPSPGADRWVSDFSRRTLIPYLFVSQGDGMKQVLMSTLALGLFASSIATLLYQLITWETYRLDPDAYAAWNPYQSEGSLSEIVYQTGVKLEGLITAFKFFPSFLALGYVGYAISRWRDFQAMSYTIMGKLHTTATMVGGAIGGTEQDRMEEAKQLAFKIYRYMQAAHILVYRSRNPWFQLLELEDFITLGLLTREEVAAMKPCESTCYMNEMLVSWIVRTAQEGFKDKILPDAPGCFRTCDLVSLRGALATLEAQFYVGQPNLWTALMKIVCDLLVAMFVVGAAFSSFLYQLGPFQVYVLVFAILLALPWLCAQKLVEILNNPFNASHDMFSTDAFVAFSERTTFVTLRCGWQGDKSTDGTPPRKSRVALAGEPALRPATAALKQEVQTSFSGMDTILRAAS